MFSKKNDVLLKAAFEETFAYLLRFFFSNADDIFDFARGFVFMDKELRELFPELETSGGTRQVDMLAKVFLLDGTEKWILVHIEIQEQFDKQTDTLTGKTSAMGIIETIKMIEREEGMEKGLEKGMEKGIEQSKTEFVKTLLATKRFTTAEIANFASVTEEFVNKVGKTYQ